MPKLPEPIEAYFASASPTDYTALANVFHNDAIVHDEQREHQGITAIRAWRLDVMARTPFEARPLSFEQEGELVIVPTEVSGTFPGSPVILDHRFTLRDNRIVKLEIR